MSEKRRAPRDTPNEVWTVFGKWRRRSAASKRVGVALLLLSLLLTLIWARTPRSAPTLDDATAPPGIVAVVDAAACAPDAPPGALPISLPLASEAAWSELSGASVCFTHELIVVDSALQLRRGEVGVGLARPFAPAAPGRELRELTLSHPTLAEAEPRLRNGDALLAVHGVIEAPQRLRAEGWSHEVRNPTPAEPPPLGDAALRLAAVNLGNLFLTPGVRRAELPLAQQLPKLLATLVALDADALALAEVENDAGETLELLVAELNAGQDALGRGAAAHYAAVPSGRLGTDAVRVAILYRPARLALRGWAADEARVHLRPPLAAHFEALVGGPDVTLIAAHHRSKSSCPSAGDVDRGFGCWNLQRDAQSEALLDFAAALRARGYPPAVVLGDLNAYRFEPPIERFARAGWSLAVDAMPAEAAYSYVFFGLAGALDHAALAPELAERLSAAAFWSVNADEPFGAEAQSPTPTRASDHDPLLLGLR